MLNQHSVNYQRIERAIAFITDHYQQQPTLIEAAESIQLSPFYFQRIFTEWAGVSPKKFMQYLTVEYAKDLLKQQQSSLLDVAYESGLSGTGRLHDLFINIEGMTPGEFKNGGAGLSINTCLYASPFGPLFIATTPKGVCQMLFEADDEKALAELTAKYPNARIQHAVDKFQQHALALFQKDWQQLDQVKLHLSATPFQLKVWESLLRIPKGALVTYGDIAKQIGQPSASRAVGAAIGSNPVAFLIPCHRVIQSTGQLGGYRWGMAKKSAIIGWEAAELRM